MPKPSLIQPDTDANVRDARRILHAKICACGYPKKGVRALCTKCEAFLTPGMRRALSGEFAGGILFSYSCALRLLSEFYSRSATNIRKARAANA